jgi:hypothetical protein
MNLTTPLIFRASAAQRAVAFILALGCLFVAGRGILMVFQNVPKIWYQLKLAQSHVGEPTALIWFSLIMACLGVLIAGVLLLLTTLTLIVIEGTQVLVDDLGILVECTLLPGPFARRLGAGRIQWKDVTRIERRKMFFVLQGQDDPNGAKTKEIIRFLFVDELERLIILIIERSPNLKLSS